MLPLDTFDDSRWPEPLEYMFDDSQVLQALVSPVVVRVCRYYVYCTGSPPPGIVSCAGILVATCLSFALFCMCCIVGCYCSVHVQVVMHVQVHVLVVCRCSACAIAYVMRVQRAGISWSLYVNKLFFFSLNFFFFSRVFCNVSFLCDIVFFFFFFFSALLFISPFSILLRVLRVIMWTSDDDPSMKAVDDESDNE